MTSDKEALRNDVLTDSVSRGRMPFRLIAEPQKWGGGGGAQGYPFIHVDVSMLTILLA
jgi:hypothetical protein